MQAMVNKSKQLFLFFECQNNQFRTSQMREAAERTNVHKNINPNTLVSGLIFSSYFRKLQIRWDVQ